MYTFFKSFFLSNLNKTLNSKHLNALKDGMTSIIPMIIIGSFFMIIIQFPYKNYYIFMKKLFGTNWKIIFQYPANVTFQIMGLIAAGSISYYLSRSENNINPFNASIISIACYLLTIPMKIYKNAFYIPLLSLSSIGLFTAILIGLFITDLYISLTKKGITIKMPDSVPNSVKESFSSLIPGFICIFIIWIFKEIIEHSAMKSIPNVINFILAKPLEKVNDTLAGAIVTELIICLLWFVGVHGASVVNGIMSPIWLSALAQNAIASNLGKPIPNIVTTPFFNCFVRIGGAGATLGLTILLLTAKSSKYKTLGRLSILPALFNVNEPLIFGIPLVLNFKAFIPFIIVPQLNVIITYLSMKMHIVAKTLGIMVPWTTPPIISGYLATGSISGSVLQAILIVIDFITYLIFFKKIDLDELNIEKETNL